MAGVDVLAELAGALQAQPTVPMGAELPDRVASQSVPAFAVSAMKDPKGANLDRIQIIKGWLDNEGNSHEKIFDVAWSDARQPAADGVLPAVGNTVDPNTASYENTIGAPALEAVWLDREFDWAAFPNWGFARYALTGAALSVVAQLSDLVKSTVKRDAGVKDSSALLPGMGGMIDRVDSLTFAAPAFYYLVTWLEL